MPGDGPTWVSGYVSLPDKTGAVHLVCSYIKVNPPMEAYLYGLAAWNDKTANFELLRVIWSKTNSPAQDRPRIPEGHPAFWKDENGKQWVLFGNPEILRGHTVGILMGIASGAAMLPYTVIKEANPPELGGTGSYATDPAARASMVAERSIPVARRRLVSWPVIRRNSRRACSAVFRLVVDTVVIGLAANDATTIMAATTNTAAMASRALREGRARHGPLRRSDPEREKL